MFNISVIVSVLLVVVALAIGILVGYIIRKSVGEKAIGSAEQKARNLILDAENRSDSSARFRLSQHEFQTARTGLCTAAYPPQAWRRNT